MRDEPREDWPDVLLMLGDQVYADEVSPATRAFIESSATVGAARRPRARLRGVHAALPRELERPGHPLAALHRVDDDDLRRPRRPRRLEHLPGVARGGPQAPLVERAHQGCAVVVLGLPAPGEPRAGGAQGRRAPEPREGGGRRRAAPGGVRLQGGPRQRRLALELLPRPRQDTSDRDRLARGPRARRGPPLDARPRGVGLGHEHATAGSTIC